MTVWELRKALEQFAPNAPVLADGLEVFRASKVGNAVELELLYVMPHEREADNAL